MKWFVIVLFSQIDGAYIFTDPVHESKEHCIASITDPEAVPMYAARLLMDMGPKAEITGIACANEDQVETIRLLYEGGIII